ncbi:MAG: AAA family ATPase [Elusimicrobia bacterium CG_4_10_14_0_8_um_filter_37_32]|nr:MAG: AAA family ATPase [Elusimicrobia bacterium CG02_land_8_20_14_3_00_37_13]PIZ13001.1 MAG: AAA family ATPase [Elusimicrobia bacterium CG_4_10_14_0_8_um_filter_37_32]
MNMDIDRIRKILKNKETLHVEFKESIEDVPKSLYETICAFLNREGGDIFLGVDNKGRIKGLDNHGIKKIMADVVSTTNNAEKLNPPFLLFPKQIEFKGKNILQIQVPESSRVHTLNGIVYDRSADGDFKVKRPEQIASISNRKSGYYSESRVYPYLTINDFDKTTLRKTRNLISSHMSEHPWLGFDTKGMLLKAGLYQKDFLTGESGYTLAAVLLFGKEESIQGIIPHYKIDALVKKKNTDRYDDRVDIRVNLIEAYRILMSFIEKHLPDPFYLEGVIRISLREKIFREIVANLLIHREYTIALPSRLVIYSDRVEVTNPCIPHKKGVLTLKNCTPFQKNPLVSKFFTQLGLVEEIGSGIINVNKYLPLYSPNGKAEFIEDNIFKTIIGLPELFQTVTPQVTPQATPQDVLEMRNKKIIEFCKIPRKREEIQIHIGIKDREYFRNEIMIPLLKAGRIKLTIPEKPNSPKQKYQSVME